MRLLSERDAIHSAPYEWFNYGPQTTDRLLDERERALERETRALGKRRWMLKEPLNLLYVDRILARHPSARVIVMLRDGRDVTLSMQRRRPHWTLGDCAQRWKARAEKTLTFMTGPFVDARVRVVTLESLVDDSTGVLRNILVFLNEATASDCCSDTVVAKLLSYHTRSRVIHPNSTSLERPTSDEMHGQLRNWQLNQPLARRHVA